MWWWVMPLWYTGIICMMIALLIAGSVGFSNINDRNRRGRTIIILLFVLISPFVVSVASGLIYFFIHLLISIWAV